MNVQREPLTICRRWPDCLCGDGCIDVRPAESKAARRILIGLMIATALVGVGLLYVGLR
ncbi:hypothetical protein [Mesorhizobium sp.]|uniref:hypothetical protein n=1 Tax=Mesorhizobium sp. TaxID=1871066 RepID=UPI0025F48AFD|nr:hypothetical protein [Mesorhizobium sp.]